jgi:hypothetical protein
VPMTALAIARIRAALALAAATHRVDSLRCEGSDAMGAKRTCRERRQPVDLTKMTHQRHWLCTAAMVLMPGHRARRPVIR